MVFSTKLESFIWDKDSSLLEFLVRLQGLYSQYFIFFVTYEWDQKASFT